jgi:hypothetical protein
MKKLTYILIFSVLIFSCDSKDDFIQDVYVNEFIDLSLDPYNQLITAGSSILIDNIGVEGIIIYHAVGNDYKVYDRNCSYEPSLSCSYIDSINSTVAYCGCCSAAFSLSEDGRVLNSPALLPLKQYHWHLQGSQMHIYN